MFEVIIFALILSFLVIIHELGHFLVARKVGIKVLEFGLGYPPRAKQLFAWGETIFSLNWIPFGGFVKMDGEDEPVAETPETMKKTKKGQRYDQYSYSQKFNEKPALARLAVVVAGATVNLVFGVLAFATVFSLSGIPDLVSTARIGEVQKDSPAAQAGLAANREIRKISTQETTLTTPTPDQVIELINQSKGKTVMVELSGECQAKKCNDQTQTYQVYVRTPEETPAGQGAMGVVFNQAVSVFYPWYEMPFRSIWYGLQQAVWMSAQIILALQNVVVQLVMKANVSNELSGPVGIVHQAQQYGIFQQGGLAILAFAGMLSVNLGIMNLLPIPALDGGRAIFIMLEPLIVKKRLSSIEGYIHYGGFVVLIGLIVLVTARDIWKIFYG
jgi:regulator of sigma E protease